jgi:FKBP-type peptidyl-prolyl cis-trans isomerase (trigger factor)
MKWEMIPLEDGYREGRVEVPWEEIRPDYDVILQDYTRQKVPGFRPGKVPRQVIKQRFRRQISQALAQGGARRWCRLMLEEAGMEAASPIEVSEVEWEAGQYFRFTARFLPLPEFELPDYRSLGLGAKAADDPQGALSLRLLELVSFPIPDEMVRAELNLDGVVESEPDREPWQAAAQRVKLMLILKRIARRKGIEVEEADIDRRIEERAAEFGARPDTLRADLDKGGGRARLKDLLLAESVLEYLLEDLQDQLT